MNGKNLNDHLATLRRWKQRRANLIPDKNGKLIMQRNATTVSDGIVSTRSKTYQALPTIVDEHGSQQKGTPTSEHIELFGGMSTKQIFALKRDSVFDKVNGYWIARYMAKEYYVMPFVKAMTVDKYYAREYGASCKTNALIGAELPNSSDSVFFANEKVATAMGYHSDAWGKWMYDWGSGTTDEDISSSEYAYSYHHMRRTHSRGSELERFTLGIEIEKEDSDVLTEIDKDELYTHTGWCIECDSSLNSNGGFEAVSSILPMMKTQKVIDALMEIEHIVCADYSDRCGGHIHIGDTERGQSELYYDIAGYFPLLYAMYPKRAVNGYSRAAHRDSMRNNSGHSVAVNCSSRSTVEIRLFPAPSNVQTLVWRIRLVQIMVMNPCRNSHDLRKMLMDTTSALYKHLRLVYKSDAALQNKFNLVKLFAAQVEGERIRKMSVKDLTGRLVYEKTKATKFIRKAQRKIATNA